MGWPCKLPSRYGITEFWLSSDTAPRFSLSDSSGELSPALILGCASQQSGTSSHLLRIHIFLPSLRPFLPSGPSQDSCRKSGQLSSQREGSPPGGAGTDTGITEQPWALLLPSIGKNIKKTSIPRRGKTGAIQVGIQVIGSSCKQG